MNREPFTTSPIVNKRRELEGLQQILDMVEKGCYIYTTNERVLPQEVISELDGNN